MAVNTAIEKLIARADDDGQAAEIVIRYGSKLKQSGLFEVQTSIKSNSSGNSVSGYSPGHGEVTVQDSEREKHIEKNFGVYKDRIGHYRLWKTAEGGLRFHHFWKSDMTTMGIDGKEPQEFYLGYDQRSLALTYLGLRHKHPLALRIGKFTLVFMTYHLERIYGPKEVPILWHLGFEIRYV